MKKYELGNHKMIENFIEMFNSVDEEFSIYTVSGLVIGDGYQFTAVVEYYEIDKNEKFEIDMIHEEVKACLILSELLEIPFFVIVYEYGNDYFNIIDVSLGREFKKQFVENDCGKNEFAEWWRNYKKTSQIKPFYIDGYYNWKINEVLEKNNLKWGGDIDSIIVDSDNKIKSIIEYRKSTKIRITSYDPANYFKGIGKRAGDYNTWKPLVELKTKIDVPLKLITLSELNPGKCGLSEVESIDQDHLYYTNNIKPNLNIYSSFAKLYNELTK